MALPTIVPMIIGVYRWLKSGHTLAGVDETRASKLAIKGVAVYFLGVLVAC